MLMFSIFCPLLCGNQIKDIQQHLKECKKKNLLNKYYFQCPFNPNHIISKNVFPYHKENCPDKKVNTEIDNIVDNSELEEFGASNEFCGSFKTSAKTGLNINESMEYLIKEVFSYVKR